MGRQASCVMVVMLILAAATPAFSQASDSRRPSFEVAAIKPFRAGDPCCSYRNAGGGRFSVVGLTLKILVNLAYQVEDFQIFGGPSWINTDQFNIDAKAEAVTDITRERLPLLLQSLLEDRFKLKIHAETRELPAYELMLDRNGSKLKGADAPEPLLPGAPSPPFRLDDFQWTMGDMSGAAVPFDIFVQALSQLLGRPILDKTGLTGFFQIKLQWTPDPAIDPGGRSPQEQSQVLGPSVFTAIQEQLGLRLESTKGPVQALIIDSVERPSEN